jgi:hypothetical protein
VGAFEAEHIAGLKELFELGISRQRVILDLIDLKLVDREGVRFLMHCEAVSENAQSGQREI